MPRATKADIIRSIFAAYQSKDRTILENLLTDDFRFTSPYDDEIDRTTYFERCWPSSDRMRSVVVEQVFAEGDSAFARYKLTLLDGREFRNTEFFQFDGDRIRRVDVYFGATYKAGAFIKQH